MSPLADVASAAGGLQLTYLWPCNLATWQHWHGVRTQWRVGAGGATGLDYAGVQAYLAMQDLSAADLREVFAGIQAAEAATLEVWADQRKTKT